jgi:hypothetical protein
MSVRFALAAPLVLAFAAGANAQSRGGHATRLNSAQTVRSISPAQVNFVPADPRFSSNFVPVGAFPFSTAGAPGLGFDFVHLAAITRNLTPSNLRSLFPPAEIQPVSNLTPFIPITFPMVAFAPPIIVVQQPSPVVVFQSPAASSEEEDLSNALQRHVRETPPPAQEYVPPPPPPPSQDTGEYVLVKLDGSLLFAVAFSARGDQLIYITREGVRRSLVLSQLDAVATREINEQRGTSIQLPQ